MEVIVQLIISEQPTQMCALLDGSYYLSYSLAHKLLNFEFIVQHLVTPNTCNLPM